MTTTNPARIAVDIGGTFTDIGLENGTSLVTAKVLTTRDDPVRGVIDVIRIASDNANCSAESIGSVIHGTTLATNALIERKGAKVGLITTAGFRDIIEIAYERRYDQYDIFIDKPDLLVKREDCWTVAERVDANGEVLLALDTSQIDELIKVIDNRGVESLAICLLHSYLNPRHEIELRELIRARRPELTITLSCEVCPEIREFDRACTALANAYIKPLMANYLTALSTALTSEGIEAPLFIVTSGGGMTTLETATRFPIRLVESGPSGGAVLAAKIARECNIDGALSFDMGGTTAKLCLIDQGAPQRSRQFEIGRAARFVKGSGLPVRIPVVEMIEIGAGGGSLARVDTLQRLIVGPDSAGSDPGPACYGLGGELPSVTDADVALGFIDPKAFAERRVKLYPKAASAAIKAQIGAQLGLSANQAAYGISQMVDESMSNAARVHAVEHGKEVSTRTMIAFGGNGPLHATRVAEKIGVKKVIIPRNPGVGSAVGFLSAPISYEIIRSLYMRGLDFDHQAVRRLFTEMEREGRAVVRAGASNTKLNEQRLAFMRYQGQGHEIEIPLPAGKLGAGLVKEIRKRFDRLYQQQYGRIIPNVDVEIINWAFVAATPSPLTRKLTAIRRKRRPRPDGKRKIYWGQSRKTLNVACYRRESLQAGDCIAGPALIVENQTTTLVGPSFDAALDKVGNIVLTSAQKSRAESNGR
ncbi:MAG: hydantoinase/oxoprolinase family protein [Gammaproteobacteria bacterium]|nr:hydantoinase/oxoprolinase family protein [Gammaproteobacteria bacterium]